MKIVVSKLEASSRQTNTAIRLLFSGMDPVSVHTLTMASLGILKDLGIKKRSKLNQTMEDHIVEEHRTEFWKAFRKPAAFFKHAKDDPNELLEFNENANDYLLLICAEFYKELVGSVTLEMDTYMRWFDNLYPHLVKEPKFLAQKQEAAKWTREKKLDFGSLLLRRAEGRKT